MSYITQVKYLKDGNVAGYTDYFDTLDTTDPAQYSTAQYLSDIGSIVMYWPGVISSRFEGRSMLDTILHTNSDDVTKLLAFLEANNPYFSNEKVYMEGLGFQLVVTTEENV
jgi:hypothetical protein